MVFDSLTPQDIEHQIVINLPTSPVYYGCTTLKSVKKSHF